MKYIIVSNYFYPEIGAASNRITNMSCGLSSNDISVICPIPNYPQGRIFKKYKSKLYVKEKISGVNVYRYFIYPSNSKNPLVRLLSMFSFAFSLWFFSFNYRHIMKTDKVIIQNSPFLVSLSAIILFKYVYRKKIVLNVSDLWPISAFDLGSINKGLLFTFLEKIELFMYRSSDFILGQSNEILNHVNKKVDIKTFLYRNIQPKIKTSNSKKRKNFTLVYAGLLGVAQDVYGILSNIDFKQINIEFHIYGDGNQKLKIKNQINTSKNKHVRYCGTLPKNQLDKIISQYHIALVPLKNRIRGAVPSKIFELCQKKIPILFFGEGEGAEIIRKHKLGDVVSDNNYVELKKKLLFFSKLTPKDYNKYVNNCSKYSFNNINFNKQIKELDFFLKN
tara:strand:+ start:3834 stop:5006 length:1173 start_codon:yes stop_codon:yes gene_type:complete